ncbi:MAG TPA: ATP-binding cassette domain-containing protein [Chitinophagales bacterium]|nr:ATP-binding cassette domain-containing protein [Chitinophagales bacterium]HNL85322.1 ATP-binding cassette domain-containing protein [Chitinophagales bacterium]
MTITLQNISKRFGFEWIFKQIQFSFEEGGKYAVVGPNGSGKSTLLKIISGGLTPTSGKVDFGELEEIAVQKIVYAAPYISLIEDFTLEEMYKFHAAFKTFYTSEEAEFYAISELEKHKTKYIKNFSSGMRQRLKLTFAFLTQSELILLDEPTSNFDTKAVDWYLSMKEKYVGKRTLIIGSNQAYEYEDCSLQLDIMQYK